MYPIHGCWYTICSYLRSANLIELNEMKLFLSKVSFYRRRSTISIFANHTQLLPCVCAIVISFDLVDFVIVGIANNKIRNCHCGIGVCVCVFVHIYHTSN